MNKTPLYVDLDGTLIKTDILHESIILLLKTSFIKLFLLPFWLMGGKANLKKKLSESIIPDVTTLPYNEEFLDYLKREKKQGRVLILATASHFTIAEKIAEYLNIFNCILATEVNNLSGARKLEEIKKHSDGNEFAYAGNDIKDLPIIRDSKTAILVNPSYSLTKATRKFRNIDKIFKSSKNSAFMIFNSLRIHQWSKNLLLFIPLILAHKFDDWDIILQALFAFIVFSCIASGTYVLNDLLDLTSDRSHPSKKHRPFASGMLSVDTGLVLFLSLTGGGLVIAYILDPEFSLLCIAYLATTLMYSFFLKSFIIIDAIVLASLYTLRIITGSVVADVIASFWLLSFSMFIFISLALVKRCTELEIFLKEKKVSLHGRNYLVSDLSILKSMGVASGYLSILVIALYINNPEVTEMYENPQRLWLLCPLLLYWISRMWVKTNREEMHDDPIVYSIKDRTSILSALLVIIIIFSAI